MVKSLHPENSILSGEVESHDNFTLVDEMTRREGRENRQTDLWSLIDDCYEDIMHDRINGILGG